MLSVPRLLSNEMKTSITPVFLLLGTLLALCGCNPKPTAPSSPPVNAQNTSEAPGASKEAPPFRLEEVSAARGITFRHTFGPRLPLTIVEAMGSGCAFLDYDNDGWQDVFLVNAGDDFQKATQKPGCKLFHNKGNGQFEEVTAQSGIVIESYAMGCCVGDYDNDGLPDLCVTGYGRNYLFRNLGQGKFKDSTKADGLLQRPGAWGMGCAFVDVNRDGWLDLYIANYVVYDPKIPFCRSANVEHGCTPNQYKTQPNELYINRKNGTFVEKAKELGAEDGTGAGLGVVVADMDNDGWQDIFVANDGTPNALLHNKQGRFENIGQVAGVAYGEDGVMRAGMGTDANDFDGDGLLDLIITNFQHEPNALYHNSGRMNFQEVSYPSGIGTPTLNALAFGVAFADLDGDGWLDLYVGNGHVYDNVEKFDDTATFEQQDMIFLNERNGRFHLIDAATGAYPALKSVTRSVAVGDFNNDGAPDILINSLGRPARLLENRPARAAHWLGLRLEGTTRNRSALGARIELRGAGPLQVREVRSGGSYLAQADLRALFRLSSVSDPSGLSVTIRWPNGKTQTWKPKTLDSYTTLREPEHFTTK